MVKQPELDYEKLVGFLDKKKEAKAEDKIPADAVRGRLRKVAFDVYNIENDPYDTLWRLESNADDGKEYLVRMDLDTPSVEAKTGGWTATSNESGNSVTLAYRGVPIQRLSGKIFGFSGKDVGLFKQALLEKVGKDDGFKNKLLDMQPEDKKIELVKAFPELAVRNK